METGLLDELNEAQKEAVLQTEGPVMVMAGAGSGKTKVLTHRIAYLLLEKQVPLDAILAVTFTNKAAAEMKQRVQNLVGENTMWMWISTFHSFCARFLRREIHLLPPYTSNFGILDEEDSLKVVKDIVKEEQIDDFKPKTFRNLISKVKNFPQYKSSNLPLWNRYLRVSQRYQQRLAESNLLDFDDLLVRTLDIFKKDPMVLNHYQNKFRYILVDEFQDTNDLQYELIQKLANAHQNVFVVGDDCQSIYSFRGANIKNIELFQKDFPKFRLVKLERNYRSTTQILDVANELIRKNPNQIPKTLYSSNTHGVLPFYYAADSSYEEVMFVIDKIRQLHLAGDSYRDFAIIYRANYISRNFEELLIRYQIPYKIYGALSFYSRKEIKDMLAYIKVMISPEDQISFRRIINEPKRKIGPMLVERLQEYAYETHQTLLEAIPTFPKKGQGSEALKNFYDMIHSVKAQLENIELKNLIDVLLEETGYKEMLMSEEDQDRLNNIYELKGVFKEIDEFYEGTPLEKLSGFMQDLALRTDMDDETEEDSVCLTTYHQAKGLEFKTVFMVAMEEGIFPSEGFNDVDMEEERRVCYVGVTRAKERLFLTSANRRLLFGTYQQMAPSRFLKELFAQKGKPKEKSREKPAPLAISKPSSHEEIRVGDKITHKMFGDGLVIQKDGNVIQVAFKMPVGIKKLLADHPSIVKKKDSQKD